MKKIFAILVLAAIAFAACNRKAASSNGKMKGRLVIKELCAHYVIEVIEGNVDTSMVVNGWRDEKRNKTYDKVFTVSNRCTFPANDLKEGDEFEFSFDKNPPPEDCMVCMAYYEVPAKRNAVKIVK
ncbi:MAG TPA: hypothetical protein VD996_11515 [Chitinophagaceae bacterium]|nr:hypothetical protein [Chitinophagaceae bacterium]